MTAAKHDTARQTESGYHPLLILIVLFALSRLVYFLLGVRFDAGPLEYAWQYIDPTLLKSDLFESLFYLHSQPPLFNLFLGIVLKLSMGHETLMFHLTYLGLGLILNISLFLLMIRLGVGVRLSLILTGTFLISPAGILYENYLFYTYPVATLLCLSALFLHRYLNSGRSLNLTIFFALLFCVVLTRSLFHLIWLALIIIMLIYFRRADLKRILVVGGICFVLCLSVYVKNAQVFGSFSTSTWTGMNMARLITWKLDMRERIELVKQRKLTTLALAKPFRELEVYERRLGFPIAPQTGHPVLDQQVKSTGYPNMNNPTYIELSRHYSIDAGYVVKHYPASCAKGLLESFHIYSIPASSYSFLKNNRDCISYLDRAYNLVLFGQFDYEDVFAEDRTFFNSGLFIMLGYLFLIVYGFILIKRSLSRRTVNPTDVITVLFLWFNIVYITLLGNAFELGENNRFRFLTEPAAVVLLGLAIKNKFRPLK